ncbi:hypothetical protein BDY19DRAFT_950300 [Irpex rosettiformis]|uniref:Uncharacterized protein n=1 Tax=Irpex rosettiformis TaxID=378272 RepID=A0ACB8U1Y1_9APHY|nr:hypothetical protein BDY19DRAFT_950300 [Irpex rosettiformis]
MPEVVIASSATSASTISPPPAAFQPSIRILRRPSAMSNGQPVTPQTNAQQKSFVQREVDYQLARDRIFGESSGRAETVASTVVKHDPSGSPTPRDAPGCLPPRNATPPTAKIIRNPRGPDTSPNGSKMTPVKGFKNRRPKEFQSSKETRPS